jgi:hypothetical protein
VQDDLILEGIQEMKGAEVVALPWLPPLQKFQTHMETRRALASTSNVHVDVSWLRICKLEWFQYGRVKGVHVLRTVLEAALSSIRALQFQKAADVRFLLQKQRWFPLI